MAVTMRISHIAHHNGIMTRGNTRRVARVVSRVTCLFGMQILVSMCKVSSHNGILQPKSKSKREVENGGIDPPTSRMLSERSTI